MSLIVAELYFTHFSTFLMTMKYHSCKNKAGKKLEGNTLASILVYKVYVERSQTKFFSRNSG